MRFSEVARDREAEADRVLQRLPFAPAQWDADSKVQPSPEGVDDGWYEDPVHR